MRLAGWDYRTAGAYFITIVTHKRIRLFDDDDLRAIAETGWNLIRAGQAGQSLTVDETVVMPDHVHAILMIGLGAETAQDTPLPAIGTLVGSYKTQTARRINVLRRSINAPVWQRGYHDRIIRNERELDAVRQYIANNPHLKGDW